MARKYRLNINGSPVTGVNFGGAAWQGNLNANGVEVSYEDTPYVPPPLPVPQPDTVWNFSAEPAIPATGWAQWSMDRNGPMFPTQTWSLNKWLKLDTWPFIRVSGSSLFIGAHVRHGESTNLSGVSGGGPDGYVYPSNHIFSIVVSPRRWEVQLPALRVPNPPLTGGSL